MKIRSHKSRAWLLLPTLVLFGCDTALTQWFQPTSYWAGEFASANEFSPLWDFTMRSGPFVHLTASLVYVAIVSGLVFRLPGRAALVTSLTVLLWHFFGSASWITYHLPQGYWLTVGYGVLVAILLEVSYRRAGVWR